jgi:hypothetical protein
MSQAIVNETKVISDEEILKNGGTIMCGSICWENYKPQAQCYTVSREEAVEMLKGEWYDIKKDIKKGCFKQAKQWCQIDTKKRIKYILVMTSKNKRFLCKQNKFVKYTYPMFVNPSWEGAIEHFSQGFGKSDVSWHPYGDVVIVV